MNSCVTAPIAIIGIACRLPGGVASPDALWPILAHGRDAVTRVPQSRWDTSRFLHPRRSMPGGTVSVCAGVIEDIYAFDAAFFGISRKEAETMDPQQRLLLELTWEALEDARIQPSHLAGSDTAVFVGAASPDAGTCHADDICATSPYSMTGTNLSIIANRVSYIFDFHGPSMTIDTACSSAMHAMHQACQTLAAGGASLAVAGGVNVLLSPYPFVGFSQAHMLSPEGRCKVFDASGDGYVRSEGGGVLLLQPLADALAQGRRIHAVIQGIACNSDGRTQGIALPSAEAQERLLREVYDAACRRPEQLAYLEAHGTGTAAGDPVETAAIGRALGMRRAEPLAIGSVKCNLGHLETASAIAGVMKSLLVLRQKRIPRQIHISRINPAIDLKGLNLRVPLRMTRLPRVGGRPVVGVNSFGFGGANGHLLLEAAPEAPRNARRVHAVPPLFLSARCEDSLRALAGKYAQRLDGRENEYYDLAAGAAFAREAMPCRLVVDAGSTGGSIAALRAFSEASEGVSKHPHLCRGEAVRTEVKPDAARPLTAFVFSGNGGQWAGMGRALLENAAFAARAREIADLMLPLSGVNLVEQLRTATPRDMERTEVAQQLLFLVQAGLCAALAEAGVTPDAVFGHSVGEVAAAWRSGALSLKDAVKVIYYRSLYQGQTHGLGRMAAASVDAAEAARLAEHYGDVEIAGINAADAVTFSGSGESLARIGEELRKRRIFFKMLPLEYAFHSSRMDGVKAGLLGSLKGLRGRPARIPFISTVTGGVMRESCTGAYWWRNVRQPVDFQQATQTALDMGVRFFLEIGPHSILLRYMHSGLRQARLDGWTGGTLTRDGDCLRQFETAWRAAWAHGWPLDLRKRFPVSSRPVSLPLYPWNHEDCQTAPTPECAGYIKARAEHPLLGRRAPGAHVWENTLDLETRSWIGDHKVGDSVFYPAAAFLEMSLAAAQRAGYGDGPVEMLNTAILRPMLFHDRQPMKLRTTVDATDGEVRILARPHMRDEQWVVYAKGRAARMDASPPPPCAAVQCPENFGEEMSPRELYELTATANMGYGPIFRPVERLWRKGDSILARFAQAPSAEPAQTWETDMLVPPPLLDGGLQLLFPLIDGLLKENPAPRLPYWFERCTLFRPGRPAFALLRLDKASRRTVVCSLSLLDAEGHALLRLHRGHARTVERLAAGGASVYETRSVPQPHPLSGLPAQMPLTAALREALKARINELTARPAWKKRHGETVPLRDLAVLSLARDLARQPAPACPPHLAAYLREQLAARGADFAAALPPFEEIWRTLMADAPEDATVNLLLANAHNVLLRGAPPLPPDSPLRDGYYRHEQRLTSGLLRDALADLLAACPRGEALHVMEAGAAPGGVSRTILPLLRDHVYTITDKSADALGKLRLALGAHCGDELVEFASWNPEQGDMPAHKAHILVAAYCLRDMDNIAQALRRCRDALHPGGYLLLAETVPGLTENLVLGQTEDWWDASPSPDEPVSRLLAPDAWQSAVERAGFEDAVILRPGDGQRRENSFLLLARAARAAEPEAPESPPEETWLLLEDATPSPLARTLLDALHERLAASGVMATRVRAADSLRLRGRVWGLCPDKAAHWRALWEKLSAGGQKIVCVDALGLAEDGLAWEAAQKQCDALLQLARGWDLAGQPQASLRVLTANAQDHPGAATRLAPAQACAIGAARVLMNEMPALGTRCIDLHPSGGEDAVLLERCRRELLFPTAEREVILSGGQRYVTRSLEPARSHASGTAGEALRLECESPGRLETLYWRPVPGPVPGPGMVVVAVQATGLNFRDVMWAMNLLPEEALENGFSGPGLGIECAGVVESVGSGVSSVVPGQRVICFAPHCFGTHVLTTAEAVAPIPGQWSFAEAATVPVAFFTAYYALRHLADLQPGESVLIHGAAGGVGLAAIQIAAHMELEIFATAGSEDKRHMLRLLGVNHVYDSRSQAFRDQVLADTDGRGVDAVLNSLAGDGMDNSLQTLRPFGRFLELGKRDFYADTPLRLRPFRNNVSYFGIDVDQLMKLRPALGQRLFHEMMEYFRDGIWRPLPFSLYPGDEAEAAFRAMQQSRHVGKVVVETPHAAAAAAPVATRGLQARADGTYLVSGGLDGFGLMTARRLAQHGAGALVLLSRRGETPQNAAALRQLQREGLPEGRQRPVLALAQDVADEKTLPSVLDAALRGLPPLRGVVHAAAVLDDASVARMTPERLARVLRPKAGGAFNLHAYTLDKKLDFFIMYSSATTLLGNPGQANYVAANMALESLAALRRGMGLPGLAVAWGAIGDAGMLTRDAGTLESLKRMTGIAPMRALDALNALERLPGGTGPAPALFTADWKRLSHLPLGQTPRLDPLRPENATQETAAGVSLRESIKGKNAEEALDCITEAVTGTVARILRVAASAVRPNTPLADMGMDSLMAMELGLALEELLDGAVLSGGLSAGTTIRDLAGRLHAILSGNEDGLDDMRRAMEASHGIAVKDEMADAAFHAGRRIPHE